MKRRHFVEILGMGAGMSVLERFRYEFLNYNDLFEDGDTVCFIGDSISHGGKYQTMIANYFLTRFPERNIRFVNCGISGDTSAGVIRRWETGIIPKNPTVAVVMLGMNDVHREFYNTNSPSGERLLCRGQAFTDYRKNMEEIVSRLKLAGCRVIVLLTPSPYDQTAKLEVENNFGVNDALGDLGKFLKKIKAKEDIRLIDFNGPMTGILLSQQKENPSFSFASNDRIHPDESGHQLRDLISINIILTDRKISLDNDKEIHLFFDRFPYGEGSYATRYYEELFSSFFQIRNNLEYLKQEMMELNRQLHSENLPHPHHYELTPNR